MSKARKSTFVAYGKGSYLAYVQDRKGNTTVHRFNDRYSALGYVDGLRCRSSLRTEVAHVEHPCPYCHGCGELEYGSIITGEIWHGTCWRCKGGGKRGDDYMLKLTQP